VPESVQVTPLFCASFCRVAANGCAVDIVTEAEDGAMLTETSRVGVFEDEEETEPQPMRPSPPISAVARARRVSCQRRQPLLPPR